MTQLTDRYVAAVVRAVPPAQRADVAAELRASIADAVEDLEGAGLAADRAEERALLDLGDPSALAHRYGGPPRYLIGPAYYGDFLTVLRLVLAIVVPILALVTVWSSVESDVGPFGTVADTVGAMLAGAIHIAFWVTLVFALLERFAGPRPARDWRPSDLPELPTNRVGLADTVWSIAILAFLLFAVLWQRDHWTVAGEPVLNPDLWNFFLPLLVFVLVGSICLEIAKYRAGRWTVGLAAVNTVLNVVFAGLVIGLWDDPGIINPEVWAGLDEGVQTLLNVIPWGIGLVCLGDTAEGWWKALRR